MKDKNLKMIGSETLTARSCRTLRQAGIQEVYCATNIDEEILKLPEYVTRVGRRDDHDNKWLQSTVKDTVEDHKLFNEYEYIAVLMPNCPFISSPIVRDAADILSGGKKIVRTYNYEGSENGLIYAEMAYYMDHETDVHTGSIHSFGFEIHDLGDYVKALKLIIP